MLIKDTLVYAKNYLSDSSQSPFLDALLLLSKVTGFNKEKILLESMSIDIDNDLFDKMSIRLQTAAQLREEYPDSSLEELALYSSNIFGKSLSKSGVSHCLKDLMQYYESVKR